ncbi:MAG: hypothetical protein LBI02_04515 [Opitutaceae bacterium]|jgi:hypothetical protein|nr:hypothetical protein [Opitutaceae bacterium]
MLAAIAYILLLLVFAVVVVTLLAFAARAGAKTNDTPTQVGPRVIAAPLPPAKALSGFSREKLREMLTRIESEPAPGKKWEAMCYAPAVPPNRAEYLCRQCGQKTLYASAKENRDSAVVFVSWKLTTMRRLVSEIQKYTKAVTLLEDEFCSHCRRPVSPDAETFDSPQARLRIRLDGKRETITRGVTEGDLRLLLGFFPGSLEQKTSNDGTFPLNESLPRLRQLLGESPGTEIRLVPDERDGRDGATETGAEFVGIDLCGRRRRYGHGHRPKIWPAFRRTA